jgi:hypothetical protein
LALYTTDSILSTVSKDIPKCNGYAHSALMSHTTKSALKLGVNKRKKTNLRTQILIKRGRIVF